jgi:tetratricopeptide (TPR) repeat protein
VPGATRYLVTLSGEQGELWDREAPDTALAYPADEKELAAGAEYSWEVRAFTPTGPVAKAAVTTFRVASVAETAAVGAVLGRIRGSAAGTDSSAASYLAGSYLLGRGFYADAGDRFEVLLRLNPGSPAPYEALGNVYRAEGLMELAAAAFERALALSREP